MPGLALFFSLFAAFGFPAMGNADEILAELDLEEKVGQMLMAKVIEGPEGKPSSTSKQLVQDLNAGSLLFYSFPDPGSTARYTNLIQNWAEESSSGLPVLIGADLEYGVRTNVQKGVTTLPQQMGLGATGKPRLARAAAAITAKEARSMGIHWNFAPVADLNSNPNNPVIGVRSFGANPGPVGEFVRATVEGYQKNGLISTVKHYPGHGDTETDSHYDLPVVKFGEEKLHEHLRPFRVAMDAGVDAVMTAHIIVDSIDPELPATLSEEVITGLLRQKQGYKGVVITDAMNMGALEHSFGKAEAAVRAVNAGADVIMSAGSYWDALEIRNGLVEAVKQEEISRERIDRSVKRVLQLKREYGLLSEDTFVEPAVAERICGSKDHRRTAAKLAADAITLVRDRNQLIPIDKETHELLLLGVKDSVYLLEDQLERFASDLDVTVYRTPGSGRYNNWSPSEAGIEKATELATDADRVLILTYSSSVLSRRQSNMVKEVLDANKNLIVVAEGLPYDLKNFPEVPAYLATYAYNRWNSPSNGHGPITTATAKVVLGKTEAGGKLPVHRETVEPPSKD